MVEGTLSMVWRPGSLELFCAKQSISCVSQARNNVVVLIETFINCRGIDGDIRMLLMHVGNALWRREQTDQFERFGARILESMQSCDG